MKTVKVTSYEGRRTKDEGRTSHVQRPTSNVPRKTFLFVSCVFVVFIIEIQVPAYAMNAVNPAAREEIIETTINGLGGTEYPTELAPIRVKALEMLMGNEYLLAKALHLYNQRKLKEARGDLKEILMENPDNQTVSTYLTNITSKIEAAEKPKEELEEEIKGIVSVEQAQSGRIYGKEEFGNTDGQEKFTTNTSVIASKTNRKGEDWANKFIAEAMRLEGSMGDYKYTATANINYYTKDSKREDVRLRNATWWMKSDKVQFILGDTSSYLSRYVLNGVNYRGINLKMDLYQSMFGDLNDKLTILYGKVPYFWLTEDEYIYPRDIIGVRNEFDLLDRWDLNASFAYIWDASSRLTKIDTNNKAKENALIGFDQVFRIMPGIWTFYQETAFSYADDDRESDNKILRSWANYLVSDFKTNKVKVYNSYERIEPNFRSFVGLTGYTANKQVTLNREHVLNFIEYEPLDILDIGLQYSKTRTNLAKKYDTETIEEDNYKANVKLIPKNNLPRFSLRSSIWTSTSNPGTLSSPKEQSNWDSVFAIAKTLWETDLSTSYGIRGYSQYINDTSTYGDAVEHSFTLSANRKISDRLTVSPSYTYARAGLKKKPDAPVYTEKISNHLFDLSISSGLWDTAMLTFDYNFSNTEDFATPSVWGTNNAFTTTFSWPFTANLGYRKKFVFSPYLSYHYSDGKATLLDRRYFAGRLEGDYFLTENTKLNLSGEYRDNSSSDPAYVGFGDEYRIMLSYKTVNGF